MKDIKRMTNDELRAYKRELRKRRDRRNRMLRLGFMLAIIFLASISFYTISSAKASSDTVKYKYYTILEVRTNDTLWSIAEEYIDYDKYDSVKDYIHEVKNINHLENDVIKSGSRIVIPYYSEEYL